MIKLTMILMLVCLQRARFKAVESLKASKTRTVVVSTDVAARGLDIPSVSTVVHYDVARAVDTFVHRSGRTAVSEQTLLFLFLFCLYVIGDEDTFRFRTRVSYHPG